MDVGDRVCPRDGDAPDAVDTLPPGALIDAYRIVRVLGEGGMGFVYEAMNDALSRRVALKMLRPELANIQQVGARFLNEAKAVNLINHPNIIDIDDYGDRYGSAYFIMEFLEGETLDDLMRKRQPMQVPLLIHVFSQICRALAAAHSHQIVHRDLKPANVFVVARDDNPYFIKLLDFGIAQLRGEGAVQGLTMAGAVMGTPQYMSPEQVTGGTVDARTDVWALGVMMYRAATGHAPFRGDDFAELAGKILHHPPPPADTVVAHVPAELSQLIASCLERQIEQRCPSITAVLEGFERVKKASGLVDDLILAAVRADAGALDEQLPPVAVDQTRGSLKDSLPRNQLGLRPALPIAQPSAPPRIGWYMLGAVLVGGLGVVGVTALRRGDATEPARAPTTSDVRQPAPSVTESGRGAASPEQPAPSRQAQPPSLDELDQQIADALNAGDAASARTLAARALEAALTTGTPEQRLVAIDAIARVAVAPSAPLLYKALHGSPELRRKAAAALVELGSADAIPKLRDALSDAGRLIKVELAAALYRLGDRGASAILKRGLDEPAARLTAASAMAARGDADGRPVLEAYIRTTRSRSEDWRDAVAGLANLGDGEARKLLEAELAQGNAARKVAAASLLAKAGDGNARELLAQLAGDPQFARRGEAALALARLADKRALAWVEHGVASADADERIQASAICGQLGSSTPPHRAAVAAHVLDRDLAVRMTAKAAVLGL